MRQLEELVAELAPQPDVPSRLRRLPEPYIPACESTQSSAAPAPAAPTPAAPATATAPPAPAAPTTATASAAPTPAAPATAPSAPVPAPAAPAPVQTYPARRAPDPKPLAPRRYKLQVTLDQQARDTLVELQDLLAHQIPSGDPAAIVKRALSALLGQTKRKKAALVECPRASLARSDARRRTRNIPAPVRREIWARDGGRCTFVGDGGRRCNETRGLEFHHIHPWAKGGGHSTANLCLRCRAHNAYEAERDYGNEFMAQKRPGRGPLHRVREPLDQYDAAFRRRAARAPAQRPRPGWPMSGEATPVASDTSLVSAEPSGRASPSPPASGRRSSEPKPTRKRQAVERVQAHRKRQAVERAQQYLPASGRRSSEPLPTGERQLVERAPAHRQAAGGRASPSLRASGRGSSHVARANGPGWRVGRQGAPMRAEHPGHACACHGGGESR